jgi:hypothetical protein
MNKLVIVVVLFVAGALFYFLRRGKGKGGDKSTGNVVPCRSGAAVTTT